MKRILKTLTGIILILSFSVSSFASGITIYNEMGSVERMSVELGELSVAGSMERENAKIIINSYIEQGEMKTYDVVCIIDGKETHIGKLNATPYKEEKQEFSLSMLQNGIYNIKIEVRDGRRVAASIDQRLVIMDEYEHQFMDELSDYGVNVHLNQSQSRDYSPIEIDRLKFAGIKRIREAVEWRYVELAKGSYNWDYKPTSATSTKVGHNKFYQVLQEHGIEHYRILGYANPLYANFPEDDPDNVLDSWNKRGITWWGGGNMPNVPIGLVGWKNYVKASVEHWGSDNDFEIFNESQLATGMFPVRPGNANAYTTLLKFSTMGKIEAPNDGYNADINGFSIDSGGHWYLNESLKQGVYPYVSTAGTHAYVHPSDPDKNDSFRTEIRQVRTDFAEYGGWKDVNLSEFGWTFTEDPNRVYPFVSPENAAKYLVKNFVLADDVNVGERYWYVYAKYRQNEETLAKIKSGEIVDSEQNFGLFNVFYEAQPTYLTFSQLNQRLGGAVYLGEVSLGVGEGERAFLYSKDKKPVLVVWYFDGQEGETTYNLGEDVTAYDIYGNSVPVNSGSFNVGNSPLYIYGLSDEWFKKCAVENLKEMNKSYIAENSKEFSDEFSAEINTTLKNAEKTIEAETNGDNIFAAINDYAELGNKIIQKAKSGEVTQRIASKTLFRLYEVMCVLDNMYIALYDGEMPETVESDIAPLTEKLNTLYRNDKRLMQYSDEMHRHAKRFCDEAKLVFGLEDNPQKAGVVKAYDLMAGIVIKWADAFSEFEDVMRYGVFAQMPYNNCETTSGFNTNVDMSVFNFENNDITAYVKLKDEKGNVVVETDKKLIKAGEYVSMPMTFVIDKVEGVDTYYYSADIYDENDVFINNSILAFSVGDSLKVTMKPIAQTPDKANNLVFNIKNLSSDELQLKLNIKSNEDVSFGQSSIDFKLEANSDTDVNIPIVSMTDTAYHFYTVDYTIETTDGEVLYAAVQPINFSCIVKAKDKIDTVNYDGTIDAWKDAYPIYINPPKNSDQASSWQSANLAARLLYKWDSENLYVLADVYDNRLYNALSRSDMWNGDCMQMTFDVENNKTKAYDTNDLEIGFAATTLGESIHVWYTPTPYTGSENPDWLHIIRNDDIKLTRYVMAIPKSVLPGLKMSTGASFGYNVGLNEADTLYRETWYQLTNGTIDSKNPSHYETFTFIDAENKELKESMSEQIFVNKVDSKVVNTLPFIDVSEHWALNQIKSLYDSNIVKGKSNTFFDPEGTLTRAEFIQMAALVSGKITGSIYDIYSDVAKDEWYTEAVQILYENNVIPEAMVSNNLLEPNRNITREEAGVIASNVYRAVKNKTVKTGKLASVSDGEQVSEWAREGLDKAMELNIIQGDENGNLNPLNNLTRAEGATIIFNLMGKVV